MLASKPANTFDQCPVALTSFHMFFIFQIKQKFISVVSHIPTLLVNIILQVCAKIFPLSVASDNKGAII
jgi:hypothetical protein